MSEPLHPLTKEGLLRRAVDLRERGVLFDPADAIMQDLFAGSVDRFCDIALELRSSRRVLDVGAGHGVLTGFLSDLGHECYAVDWPDPSKRYPHVYQNRRISVGVCNIEVDDLPFPEATFDAVVCCQVLEHFTHSHLHAVREMRRVLRPGGILEVDVPNVASLRNRSRLLRGKNITYDYLAYYLHAEPLLYKGKSFYPLRHNREFTRGELEALLTTAGFRNVEARYLRSRRYRVGIARLRNLGSAIRDAWPSLRKSLIAYGEK
jgi:SAM-dependent methyltransferase